MRLVVAANGHSHPCISVLRDDGSHEAHRFAAAMRS